MSNSNKILPVVSLNEKSLQRLHEKYQKLVSDENLETKNAHQGNKSPSDRAPKYQVYQVGVSRLSSRKLPSHSKEKSEIQTEKTSRNEKQSKVEELSSGTKDTKPEEKKNEAKQSEKFRSEEDISDDELQWDGYNPLQFEPESFTDMPLDDQTHQVLVNKKQLFDPQNPNVPIFVSATKRKEDSPTMATTTNKTFLTTKPSNTLYYPIKDDFPNNDCGRRDQMTLNTARKKLIEKYISLILTDIDLASKHNVDQAMWKNVFHQVIEKLRQQISSCSEMETAKLKNLLIAIINEACTVYENLVSSLEQCYELNLKEMLNNLTSSRSFMKRVGKRTKLAIICCQKCLICLGDIARYKENVNGTLNYGKARHYYIQARCLEPRNGRPYNQLAVLAVRTRRRLDAIYYYIRSLATSGTPIITARESLTSLFDDARRKLKYIEDLESRKAEPVKKEHLPTNNDASELWVFTTTTEETKLRESDQKEAQTFNNKSSTSEVLKKFILVFLNVHGKLFTKIGFDTFDTKRNDALYMFKHMISEQSISLSGMTVLYLCAINFFNVYEQQQRSGIDDKSQTFLLPSIQFALQIISILSAFVTKVVHEKKLIYKQTLDPTKCQELNVVLPALKVSCDWMYANRDLWYPSPPPNENTREFDIWISMAAMCDWLCDDDLQFPVNISSSDDPNSCEVILPEDEELSGFSPLQRSENETKFVSGFDLSTDSLKERTNQCIRLVLIREFLGYLCGMEEPLLAFKNGRYVVLIEHNPEGNKALDFSFDDASELSDEQDQYDTSLGQVSFNMEDDKDISDLQLMHNSLKQAKLFQDKRKHQIQASLSVKNHGLGVQVQPKFLIPDTNCFVDHLDMIQAILHCNRFVVCVPLIVVAELEGLALESKGMDSYSMGLHKNARTAIVYLKQQFQSNQTSKLLALTNQGSPLDTISFTNQDKKGNNDDLILDCCTRFDERQKQSANGAKTVVLLSDDRNLRVKAMIKKMPTKTIPNFCKLAKIS